MPTPNSDEDVLFASPKVVVTDKRILFNTRSYAATAISSVKVGRGMSESALKSGWVSPGTILGMAVAILGVAFAAVGIALARDLPIVVLVLIAMGVSIVVLGMMIVTVTRRSSTTNRTAVEPYAVQIRTLDGQKERIAGLSEGKAQELANAISLASTRS